MKKIGAPLSGLSKYIYDLADSTVAMLQNVIVTAHHETCDY